jgi:hypothetical protein
LCLTSLSRQGNKYEKDRYKRYAGYVVKILIKKQNFIKY